MIRAMLALALFQTPAMLAAHAQADASLLQTMRNRERPLLLFAGDHDPRIAQQYAILLHHQRELTDRQVRLVLATRASVAFNKTAPGTVVATDAERSTLRSTFGVVPNQFILLLVGKDGSEKFRSTNPVPFETLQSLIDNMPMRQQEIHKP